METVLTALHVLSAVFLVGPMAILPMTALRVLRAGDRAQVGGLAKSTEVFSFASIAAVVFGFGAMSLSDPKNHLSMTTPWILISLVLWAVAMLVNLGLVVPAMQATARVDGRVDGGGVDGAGTGGTDTAGVIATGGKPDGYARIAMGSGLSSLLLVVVVILMVWKP